MASVGSCPKCGAEIDEAHPYSWCSGCGEPLPDDIKNKVPQIAALVSQARERSKQVSTDLLSVPAASADSRLPWGILGFLLGAFLGFILRPSAPFVGQLPVSAVLSRGGTLNGLDQLLVPTAQSSFNLMFLLALVGAGLGVGIASLRPKSAVAKAEPEGGNALPVPVPEDAETINNAAIVTMVEAGLGEELVLEKMKYSRSAFELSALDLARLKKAGVSDRIITAMLTKSRT